MNRMIPSLAAFLGLLTLAASAADKDTPKDLVRVASANDGIVVEVMVKEAQAVKKDDVLVRLDDRIARAKLDIQKAKVGASKADLFASEKTREEAKLRYQTMLELAKRSDGSDADVRAAKLTLDRYVSEVATRVEAIKVAEAEQRLAELVLENHTIVSPTDGVVQSVFVKPGEAARALEPVVIVRQPNAK